MYMLRIACIPLECATLGECMLRIDSVMCIRPVLDKCKYELDVPHHPPDGTAYTLDYSCALHVHAMYILCTA
jgi:hypothetical protein